MAVLLLRVNILVAALLLRVEVLVAGLLLRVEVLVAGLLLRLLRVDVLMAVLLLRLLRVDVLMVTLLLHVDILASGLLLRVEQIAFSLKMFAFPDGCVTQTTRSSGTLSICDFLRNGTKIFFNSGELVHCLPVAMGHDHAHKSKITLMNTMQ